MKIPLMLALNIKGPMKSIRICPFVIIFFLILPENRRSFAGHRCDRISRIRRIRHTVKVSIKQIGKNDPTAQTGRPVNLTDFYVKILYKLNIL